MEQITDVKTTEMNLMPSAGSKRYWWKAIASFLMVLFTMPLGHALMIIMEHVMNETVLHYSAFCYGSGGDGHGNYRRVCPRRYPPDAMGLFGGLLFGRVGWNFYLCILPIVSVHNLNWIR